MSTLTNRDLFSIFRESDINFKDFKKVWELVLTKNLFNISNLDENKGKDVRSKLKMFCKHLTDRWEKSNRTLDRFLKNYDSWLNNECFLLITSASAISASTSASTSSSFKTSRKEWTELSDRHKRRRTEPLREAESNELLYALKSKARAENNIDLAKILDYLEKNPACINKVREFCENDCTIPSKQLSREKALSIFISLNLSKSKYNLLREISAEEGMNIYPSYYQIKLAKEDCYPPKSSLLITDVSACIQLQSLLDLTVQRIFKACDKSCDESHTLKLIYKWGFDGASSQSLYKQTFGTGGFQEKSDSNIFMTSIVPLKLFNNSTVIWRNKQPSSTRYCRPIRFEFIKESAKVINTEKNRMQNKIDKLMPTKIQNHTIEHKLLFTMIDGKICSTISDTAFSVCYICGAKPSEMNDLNKVANKIVIEEHLKYGLSSLHAWIRSMEFLLHVAYNLEFKKWSARTSEDKASKLTRKRKIQERLRNELEILVDVVKEGLGNTNDGNTARKFFEDPIKTAEIIGLDASLIRRFAIILQAIASGEQIEPKRFDNFAKETAALFVELYGWYFMPVSIHKILLHGSAIIGHALLPIGQLSEEAAEARNKEFRKTREQHTRKSNRQATNEDIL